MSEIEIGSKWAHKEFYTGTVFTVVLVDEDFVRLNYSVDNVGGSFGLPTPLFIQNYMRIGEPGKAKEEAENPKDRLGIKKPRLSLVPPASVIYEALAMQNGADKYGPYNWREKKVKAMIYLDAALRHIASFIDGEECAEDSGVPHLAHAKACLGILADAKETGNLEDDRPKPGAAAALIKRYTKSA